MAGWWTPTIDSPRAHRRAGDLHGRSLGVNPPIGWLCMAAALGTTPLTAWVPVGFCRRRGPLWAHDDIAQGSPEPT
jgi:hypothetical protein